MRLTPRLLLVVCAAWGVAGLVLGAQSSLGSTLQGQAPVALSTALRGSLIQTLAWIPATLVAIVLAARFPLDARRWRRSIVVHIVAAVILITLLCVSYAAWLKFARAAAPDPEPEPEPEAEPLDDEAAESPGMMEAEEDEP